MEAAEGGLSCFSPFLFSISNCRLLYLNQFEWGLLVRLSQKRGDESMGRWYWIDIFVSVNAMGGSDGSVR